MTGRELIKWIQDHEAEDMECVTVDHGSYGQFTGPRLAYIREEGSDVWINYYCGKAANGIVF